MNKIEWKPKAYRQLRKIGNKKVELALYEGVDALAIWPDCANVKRLVNHQYQYRLRIGSYRVFFDVIGGSITIISIEEVKKRDERTY